MLDLGGTYRAVSPEETLKKLEPLLFSAFGITRVANVTGLDDINIPNYTAIRPFAKSLTASQGKGINHNLAKISAIMESIEIWHAEHLKEYDLSGSYADLHRDYPLLTIHKNNFVHNNFLEFTDEDIQSLPLNWAKGKELFSGKDIYFPMSLIEMDFESCRRQDHAFMISSSNGLASGNTYEEALCHALYEVVERDCESDFYSKVGTSQALPMLNLNSITSSHILELLQHIDLNKIKMTVYDMTNELHIPAYMVYIEDITGLRASGVCAGSGCHFSSVVALSRAITEAIQSKVTFITGNRDDAYPLVYKKMNHIPEVDSSRVCAMDTPSQKMVDFQETDVPPSFSDCIDELLMRLNKHGYEQVIVYDHTREEFQIPVVHVLVPGLKMNFFAHAQTGYGHYEL